MLGISCLVNRVGTGLRLLLQELLGLGPTDKGRIFERQFAKWIHRAKRLLPWIWG